MNPIATCSVKSLSHARPHPDFLPREKENRSSSLAMIGGWIGHTTLKFFSSVQCAFPLLGERERVRAVVKLEIALKRLFTECGRPRPQHRSISNRVLFLQHLSQYHVAAPEDGRTPSDSHSRGSCISRFQTARSPGATPLSQVVARCVLIN